MKHAESNAFLAGAPAPGFPCRNLAGLLAPMQARIEKHDVGFCLELEPIRAAEALELWLTLQPLSSLQALLLAPATPPANGRTTPVNRLGDDAIVVPTDGLPDLIDGASVADAVLIDGPIELADVQAIRATINRGGSALEADVRAVVALRILGERAVQIETRERYEAVAFVAERFPHYLAALTGRPPADYAVPEVDVVDNAINRTGSLSVRPIETEIFSTAIDVGISTASNGEKRPADTSLIYDLYSRTWHGD